MLNVRHSLIINLRGWDGDICCGDGEGSDGDVVEMETEAVGMGTVFTGTGRDPPCRPLAPMQQFSDG